MTKRPRYQPENTSAGNQRMLPLWSYPRPVCRLPFWSEICDPHLGVASRSRSGQRRVGGVVGQFASSGEGIQLRYGPRQVRLIQKFAGRMMQADGSARIQAYSDDHGRSWHLGKPVAAK